MRQIKIFAMAQPTLGSHTGVEVRYGILSNPHIIVVATSGATMPSFYHISCALCLHYFQDNDVEGIIPFL